MTYSNQIYRQNMNKSAFIILLFFSAFYGCSVNSSDIIKYGESRDVEKLKSFISQNITDEEKKELVLEACRQFVVRDLREGENYIEELMINDPKSSMSRQILKVYLSANKGFANKDRFVERYLNSYTEFPQEYEEILAKYDGGYLQGKLLENIKSLVNTSRYSLSQKAVNIFLKSSTNEDIKIANQNISEIISLDEKIKSLHRPIDYEANSIIRKLRSDISSDKDRIDALENEVSNTRREISSLEEDISSLKSSLSDYDFSVISGYVCSILSSESSSESYDIISGGEHAILTTTSVRYKTTGYFSIKARYKGTTMATTVGGYETRVDSYEEVTSYEAARYYEILREINSKKNELSRLKSKISSPQSKINALENQIALLNSSIESTKKSLDQSRQGELSATISKRENMEFELKKTLLFL